MGWSLTSRILCTVLLATAACSPPPPPMVMGYLRRPAGDEQIVPSRLYSVWIDWTEDDRWFRLCDGDSGTVVDTVDFDVFLKALAHLPRGIEIEQFQTCGGLTSYGMPDDSYARLKAEMVKGSRTWALCPLRGGDRTLICTCETRGIRRPAR